MRVDDIDREDFALMIGSKKERGIKVSYAWDSDGSEDEYITVDELISRLAKIFEIKTDWEENALYVIGTSGYLKLELDTIDIEPKFGEIINVWNCSYLEFTMSNPEFIETLEKVENVIPGFCLHNTDCEFFYADDLEV